MHAGDDIFCLRCRICHTIVRNEFVWHIEDIVPGDRIIRKIYPTSDTASCKPGSFVQLSSYLESTFMSIAYNFTRNWLVNNTWEPGSTKYLSSWVFIGRILTFCCIFIGFIELLLMANFWLSTSGSNTNTLFYNATNQCSTSTPLVSVTSCCWLTLLQVKKIITVIHERNHIKSA